jgi:DNA-binding transcriptional ArsR family regulator
MTGVWGRPPSLFYFYLPPLPRVGRGGDEGDGAWVSTRRDTYINHQTSKNPLTCNHSVTYNTSMEAEHVFKAVADHHRRHLLDSLTQANGQTLAQLCDAMPMSRIGVMKHLNILEQAGLITTRKLGRAKLHYLNPEPLQDIASWLDNYRRRWNSRMDRLENLITQAQLNEPSKEPKDANP